MLGNAHFLPSVIGDLEKIKMTCARQNDCWFKWRAGDVASTFEKGFVVRMKLEV